MYRNFLKGGALAPLPPGSAPALTHGGAGYIYINLLHTFIQYGYSYMYDIRVLVYVAYIHSKLIASYVNNKI